MFNGKLRWEEIHKESGVLFKVIAEWSYYRRGFVYDVDVEMDGQRINLLHGWCKWGLECFTPRRYIRKHSPVQWTGMDKLYAAIKEQAEEAH